MIVLALALGAVFSSLEWSAKSYAFTRQDKKSREVLFSWVQHFESLWPGVYSDPDDAFEEVALSMNGTWIPANHFAHIEGFTVDAVDRQRSGGRMTLSIYIYAGADTAGKSI
ncbi:MAG: hypothetical protein LBT15_03055, partial [Synergistaceae bacterium]|nr:hypothetical protein [Synergistaceae bacterium]